MPILHFLLDRSLPPRSFAVRHRLLGSHEHSDCRDGSAVCKCCVASGTAVLSRLRHPWPDFCGCLFRSDGLCRLPRALPARAAAPARVRLPRRLRAAADRLRKGPGGCCCVPFVALPRCSPCTSVDAVCRPGLLRWARCGSRRAGTGPIGELHATQFNRRTTEAHRTALLNSATV